EPVSAAYGLGGAGGDRRAGGGLDAGVFAGGVSGQFRGRCGYLEARGAGAVDRRGGGVPRGGAGGGGVGGGQGAAEGTRGDGAGAGDLRGAELCRRRRGAVLGE